MIAAIIWKPDLSGESGEKESYVCIILYTGCPVLRNRVHFNIAYTKGHRACIWGYFLRHSLNLKKQHRLENHFAEIGFL